MRLFITISALLVAITVVGVKAEGLTEEDREVCAEFTKSNGLTVSDVLKTSEDCKVTYCWFNDQRQVLNAVNEQMCDSNKEESHHCCQGDCRGGIESCKLSTK